MRKFPFFLNWIFRQQNNVNDFAQYTKLLHFLCNKMHRIFLANLSENWQAKTSFQLSHFALRGFLTKNWLKSSKFIREHLFERALWIYANIPAIDGKLFNRVRLHLNSFHNKILRSPKFGLWMVWWESLIDFR